MYTMIPFRSRHTAPTMFNDMLNDRFFRSFFDLNDAFAQTGFRVDVKEQENAYVIEAELPGVKQDQIELSVENDVLTVSAEMNTEKNEKNESYLYSERRTGHMSRSFNLEGIRQDGITAAYKDGVLTVTLPKMAPEAEKTARKIAITSGEAES